MYLFSGEKLKCLLGEKKESKKTEHYYLFKN